MTYQHIHSTGFVMMWMFWPLLSRYIDQVRHPIWKTFIVLPYYLPSHEIKNFFRMHSYCCVCSNFNAKIICFLCFLVLCICSLSYGDVRLQKAIFFIYVWLFIIIRRQHSRIELVKFEFCNMLFSNVTM